MREGIRGKKGANKKISAIVIIFLVLIAIAIFWIRSKGYAISQEDIIKAQESSVRGYYYTGLNWVKKSIFAFNPEEVTFIGKIKFQIKRILGFDISIWRTFLPTFFTGFLVGLWIYLIYLLASASISFNLVSRLFKGYKTYELRRLETSWLNFVGSSPWKILVIGVGYAVIMQIPIVNSFIELITFKPLLMLAHHWFLVALFRSIILAFYVGFIPGATEAYTKYKLRKKYYEAIVAAKAERDIMRVRAGI